MCGINVVIGPGITDEHERMVNKMDYRGIRTSLWHEEKNLAVGHRRLPIQGLGTGDDQPIRVKDHLIWGVGELLNFRSFEPKASNDLRTALEMYLINGPGVISFFDGFWSIFIYDMVGKKLHLFTDFLNKKPIYMAVHEEKILLSSEIYPLVNVTDSIPNIGYYSSVLKWGYDSGYMTPWVNIRTIYPGSHMIVNIDDPINTTLINYAPQLPKVSISFESLKSLVEKSVKNRLVSDIPVAVLCSGGLDSSIIYHYVKENTNDYKVFFVDNGTDSDYIGLLNIPPAQLVKLPVHAFSYDAAIFVNQTPVDLGSVHPQYCLAKAIKEEGYSVVLSGDGADELFGGYRRAQRYNSQLSDINELIHYHLPRLDRIMMSQTIELRSPWLSWEVMDFALQLPYNLRQKKDYLKATFCDIIPKSIIQRAKEPLKINTIREDEWKARVSSLKSFLSVIDGIFPSPDLDQLIAEER